MRGKLRAEGIPADIDLMDRKLKKSMEYADSMGIPYLIIIGEQEIRKKKYTLRDMAGRKEKRVGFESILKELK